MGGLIFQSSVATKSPALNLKINNMVLSYYVAIKSTCNLYNYGGKQRIYKSEKMYRKKLK